MECSRRMKVEDSLLILETLSLEKDLKKFKRLAILRENIESRIILLKSQSEPISDLPERLSKMPLFGSGVLRRAALKFLNFMSREERKNARIAAESLELLMTYVETMNDAR